MSKKYPIFVEINSLTNEQEFNIKKYLMYESFNEYLRNLVLKMVDDNPKARPNVTECLFELELIEKYIKEPIDLIKATIENINKIRNINLNNSDNNFEGNSNNKKTNSKNLINNMTLNNDNNINKMSISSNIKNNNEFKELLPKADNSLLKNVQSSNPLVNIIFAQSSGTKISISTSPDTTIAQLLWMYLKRFNRPESDGKDILFWYHLETMDFNSQKKIKEYPNLTQIEVLFKSEIIGGNNYYLNLNE